MGSNSNQGEEYLGRCLCRRRLIKSGPQARLYQQILGQSGLFLRLPLNDEVPTHPQVGTSLHLLQFPITLVVQSFYGPTKVVTLEAGSVAEKEFPPTEMLGCAAKLYVPDVTQGVIVFAVKPFST
jgi:hypothetical protein